MASSWADVENIKVDSKCRIALIAPEKRGAIAFEGHRERAGVRKPRRLWSWHATLMAWEKSNRFALRDLLTR